MLREHQYSITSHTVGPHQEGQDEKNSKLVCHWLDCNPTNTISIGTMQTMKQLCVRLRVMERIKKVLWKQFKRQNVTVVRAGVAAMG